MDEHLYAVIMAGGGGTRFWPLSRLERPKQFLSITGERSLLQATWERAVRLVGEPQRVLVVTATGYGDMTRQQLPDLSPHNLLLEPQARNTAPCIAWASAELARRDPGGVAAVLPADHLIRDVDAFIGSVRRAAAAARRHGSLVTFGIPPRYPETGYGYIEVADELQVDDGDADIAVHRVIRFREKPDLPTAEEYVEARRFVWNSGIFVWTLDAIGAALREHLPEAVEAAASMLEATDEETRAAAYGCMPATSIDFGVMERAANVACVRAPFDWSDVGSWAALCEVLPDNVEGNVSFGPLVSLDAEGNLVHVPDQLVVLLGVCGLAVVRTDDVLMVTTLERSQEVKELRERLRSLGLDHHL